MVGSLSWDRPQLEPCKSCAFSPLISSKSEARKIQSRVFELKHVHLVLISCASGLFSRLLPANQSKSKESAISNPF